MDNSQTRRPDEDRAGRRRAALERPPFRSVSDFLWQVAPTAWARVLFFLQTAPWIVPHPGVIDALLRYFQTGVLPPRIRQTGVLFEGRDMLRFREQVLVVDEVDRERYWLFPIIEEARVSFRVIDDPRRASERVQSPDGEVPYALGAVTFTFSSALSLQQNLDEFVAALMWPETAGRVPAE